MANKEITDMSEPELNEAINAGAKLLDFIDGPPDASYIDYLTPYQREENQNESDNFLLNEEFMQVQEAKDSLKDIIFNITEKLTKIGEELKILETIRNNTNKTGTAAGGGSRKKNILVEKHILAEKQNAIVNKLSTYSNKKVINYPYIFLFIIL